MRGPKPKHNWKMAEARTYCIACGAPGSARCPKCQDRQRAQMHRHCSVRGGQEVDESRLHPPPPKNQLPFISFGVKSGEAHPTTARFLVRAVAARRSRRR